MVLQISEPSENCIQTVKDMSRNKEVNDYQKLHVIIKLKLVTVRYDCCSDVVYILTGFPACLSVSEKLCIILNYLQR